MQDGITIMLQTCIQEILSSDLRHVTDYPNQGFYVFSVPPSRYWNSTLKHNETLLSNP